MKNKYIHKEYFEISNLSGFVEALDYLKKFINKNTDFKITSRDYGQGEMIYIYHKNTSSVKK